MFRSFPQSQFRVVFRILVCLGNRYSFTLKLSRISRFETVTKKMINLLFSPNCLAEVCKRAQVLQKR